MCHMANDRNYCTEVEAIARIDQPLYREIKKKKKKRKRNS